MNREIKFRGKDTQSGEWRYGYVEYNYDKSKARIVSPLYIELGNFPLQFFQVDIGTIGQFTGLHDENDKEAYFSDIVKFTPKVLSRFCYEYIDANYELLAVIDIDEYNHSVLRILYDKGQFKKGDIYHIESLLNSEIIGNIYDNKELLED